MSHAGQFIARLAISIGAGLVAFVAAFFVISYFERDLGQRIPDDEIRQLIVADSLEGGFAAGLLVTFFVFLVLLLRSDRGRASA